MVSREEYARVIESFFMEMTGAALSYNASALRALPEFGAELDEHVRQLRDPTTPPEAALPLAFGLVDEFVQATWEQTIAESYALYVDLAGGRSHRHPTEGRMEPPAAAT